MSRPGSGRDRSFARRVWRKGASAVTRAELHRRLHREPPEFGDLYRHVLVPIEGWRYRQDLALLYLLARDVPGAAAILEIGSYQGLSTTSLALGLRAGVSGGALHAVDPHTGDRQDLEQSGKTLIPSEERFRSNIERAGIADVVTAHVMTSDELATRWDGTELRVLFVDGWHSYDAVSRDLKNWAPLVADEGVVLIDDYLNYDEVRAAVDDHASALPPRIRRAGRMRLAHHQPLSPAVERLLSIPWG